MSIEMETAGLMWQPEMAPMVYTMTSSESPKAKAIEGIVVCEMPRKTALPQPMNTNTKVPMNSAAYFFQAVSLTSVVPALTELSGSISVSPILETPEQTQLKLSFLLSRLIT